MEEKITIQINKEPDFTEIWYQGVVDYLGKEYRFWLIYPKSFDEEGHQYEINVKWFYANVPREIRVLESQVIESFKQTLK